MADEPQAKKSKAGIITGAVALGLGAAVTAGVTAQRVLSRRENRRYDPYRDVPYGQVRGTAAGPVASSDGTLLHVEESGSGPVTLVLSHGFSLNCTLWHHQIEDLSSEFRIVTYDHRGHGRSALPPSDDWSLDALARDLDAVIRDSTSEDDTVIVVGHSMGGMAVLNYARLFPEMIGERVKGLVLVDTASADVMGGVAVAGGRRAQAAVQALQAVAMRLMVGKEDRLD
ncbi:MAG TPA: alpha/beta fold hydrolase, partial [Actinomycetota bacterium]|nr:alpha/beta fold hydrolase [Actinomycetota bacterium]